MATISGQVSPHADSGAPATQPALHPIQRLHTDLLAEIFTQCLPGSIVMGDDWRSSVISNQKAPLLLCRVCSSWRSLALSTPQLWKTFIFDLSTYNTTTTMVKKLPGDIRTWLGRSGTLPLTIRFLFYTHSASLVTDSLKELFEYSSRWEDVLIETTPEVPWPFVTVLPNLRGFHGSVLSINDFPFTFAPSLTNLSLHVLPPNPMSVSRIPWHQLKELSISGWVSPSMTFELLRGCPLFEKLSIHVEYFDNDDKLLPMGFVSPIKQDKLRWLWFFTTPAASVVVEKLTLPALEELTLLGTSTSSDPTCYSQFLNLFTRSKCRLTKLSLIWSKFNPDQLLGYLAHSSFQSLTSLHIEAYNYDGVPTVNHDIFSRLTYSEEQDTTPLCPKLAELSLKRCCSSEVSPSADSLGRMVRSRCFRHPPEEQLKSLDLITQYPISKEENELLELARDKGGLKLTYASGPEKKDSLGQGDIVPDYFEDSSEEWSEYGSDGSLGTEESEGEWEEGAVEDSNEDGGETMGEPEGD